MKNGWTGGQYSLYRALLGLYLTAAFVERLGSGPPALPEALGVQPDIARALVAIFALAALALAVGFRARSAAAVTALGFVWLSGPRSLIDDPASASIVWLLFAQWLVREAPYLSLERRGAPDPGSDWHLPAAVFAATWVVLALGYAYDGWMRFAEGSWFGVELLFAPLALWKRARPWIWTAMLARAATGLAPGSEAALPAGVLLLQCFAFDPGWIPARRASRSEWIFYDGACGLCHRSVRFVLAEDRPGDTFRFATIGSGAFLRAVPEIERDSFPDSTAVKTADGRLLVRSTATLHVLAALGGSWRLVAMLVGLCPAPIRDLGYDAVARVRSRLFRHPKGPCPVVTPELRARFED